MAKHTLAGEDASDVQSLFGRSLVNEHRSVVGDLLDEKWPLRDLLRFAAISRRNPKHHLVPNLVEMLNAGEIFAIVLLHYGSEPLLGEEAPIGEMELASDHIFSKKQLGRRRSQHRVITSVNGVGSVVEQNFELVAEVWTRTNDGADLQVNSLTNCVGLRILGRDWLGLDSHRPEKKLDPRP